MVDHLRAWLERTGVTRAELPGLVVAASGAVLALLVAIRLPLATAVSDPSSTLPGATPSAPVVTPAPSAPDPDLVVHVAGAVTEPGIVQLPAGGRVADALSAAGGARSDAALDVLNLARPLVDGEQVLVPTTAEVAAGAVPTAGGAPTGQQAAGASAGELPDGRLDLNSADETQLEALPGIGPVLAARIVAHREDVGGFEQAAGLRQVDGIGDGIWAEVRDLVGVAGEPAP